ncbi:hypothetical protein [Yoonia sediminilitoris]|uniref:Secreted protein n=1 Tax=Yoonia sediminilitoris TaxID=1286148 RepID=A0A2T6KB27_9RHOB|nr:hypothetical protein [Yoonia sediminilitoris]PUB12058.1 hypothetical protein C8N45_11135 [Yoonia sediminilitoris]RCW92885.1 hypothetical protein DFP92_11134 [Yoonia sediminilitoris]
MNKTKITALSAIAVAMLGTASFADGEPPVDCECEEPAGGNPGNAKPVGNSPWDGITGNSGKNRENTPRATPMDGQEDDEYEQPGGKGVGPSPL